MDSSSWVPRFHASEKMELTILWERTCPVWVSETPLSDWLEWLDWDSTETNTQNFFLEGGHYFSLKTEHAEIGSLFLHFTCRDLDLCVIWIVCNQINLTHWFKIKFILKLQAALTNCRVYIPRTSTDTKIHTWLNMCLKGVLRAGGDKSSEHLFWAKKLDFFWGGNRKCWGCSCI